MCMHNDVWGCAENFLTNVFLMLDNKLEMKFVMPDVNVFIRFSGFTSTMFIPSCCEQTCLGTRDL